MSVTLELGNVDEAGIIKYLEIILTSNIFYFRPALHVFANSPFEVDVPNWETGAAGN